MFSTLLGGSGREFWLMPTRDREGGAFYRWSWRQAVASRAAAEVVALNFGAPAGDDPARVLESREDLAAVAAAVQALDPRRRDVLILHSIDDPRIRIASLVTPHAQTLEVFPADNVFAAVKRLRQQDTRQPSKGVAKVAGRFTFDLWSGRYAESARALEYILEGLNRAVIVRQDGTVAARRVVDVHFAAFMADPFRTIRGIYERLGIELTPTADERMRRFLADHARDKHGRHAYRFADTGLVAGALRERARRYQEYFDVPSAPLP